MILFLGIPIILSVFVSYQHMASFAAKPFPTVTAKAYTARVMIVIQDKGITEFAIERYDQTQQKASMEVVKGDNTSMVVMDYHDQTVCVVSYSWSTRVASECSIFGMQQAHDNKDLGLNDNFDFFGGWKGGQTDGKPHMFSTKDMFKMGSKNPFIYKGTKTIDGIVADQWSTIIKMSSDTDGLNVNYYFTPGNWRLKGYSDSGSALPLRIEVSGKHKTNDGSTKTINHIYEYVNFETSERLEAEAFSIPEGKPCYMKGSKPKPVPVIPDVIAYTRELIDSKGNVKVEDVTHDKKMGVVMITSDVDILYDFKSGIRYSVDNYKCSVRAIDHLSDPGAKVDGNYVVDNGPEEFALLNKQFIYTGQKKTRLLDSNSWGGNIDAIPFDVHFAKSNYWKYPGLSSNSTPPLSMMKENVLYNFFDFRTVTHYNPMGRSLMYCRQRQFRAFYKISFLADKSWIPSSAFYQPENLYLLNSAVAKAAGVNYLRVEVSSGGLRWDKKTRHLYLNIRLFGPNLPQYMYRRTDNFAVQGGAVTSKLVKISESDESKAVQKSAQLCEDSASSGKFLCRNFDLCKSSDGSFNVKMYLTWTKEVIISHSSSCNHFARSVDGTPDISSQKADANLKNAIQKGQLQVAIKFENRYGRTYSSQLSAYKVEYSYRKRDLTSRMAIRKFGYMGRQLSIIKTEIVKSVQSSQDCAHACLGRTRYECKAYAFCSGSKQCILSESFPQKSKTVSSCPIFKRRYTSDFDYVPYKSIVTKDQVALIAINSLEECAINCVNYAGYKCESFDYCHFTKSCVLHESHTYAVSPKQLQNITARVCYHMSRKYLLDFQVTKNTALFSSDTKYLKTVSGVGAKECAYLCRTGNSGQGCVQFDYCASVKRCHIVSGSNSKFVSHVKNSDCQTFTLAVNTNILSSQTLTESSTSYSNGSFAGLAIAMIIIGLVLGALVLYVLHKKGLVQKIGSTP